MSFRVPAGHPSKEDGTTRRNLVLGATAGAGGVAAASLLRPELALADTTPGIINAKDAPYNAVGDGITDDTAALQAAFDAADNGADQLFIPPGTYKVTGALLAVNASNLVVRGAGMDLTTIKVASANASEAIISGGTRTGVHISDLTLDGSNIDNCIRGIDANGTVTRKNWVIERVRIKNVLDLESAAPGGWRGIYIWPCVGVQIEKCEILDCGIGMFLDACGAGVVVRDNEVRSADGTMQNGIQVLAPTADHRPALIEGNYIQGAQIDPSNNGVDGMGIRVSNSRGVRLVGNEIVDCHTAGILCGIGSFGMQVIGNTIHSCRDPVVGRGTGIYVESAGTGNIRFDTNTIRGVVVSDNWIYDCGKGINLSYCAGTIVKGNLIQNVDGDGIVSDSRGAVIQGNVVISAFTSAGTPPQLVKAGIRCYSGVGGSGRCVIIGNVCTDNQTVKTQDYGVAVSDEDHVVVGNMLKDNGLGGLFQQSGGASNTAANNEG